MPNLGGAISSSNGIFGTDLNGDGGPGTGAPRGDVLPGTKIGAFGRSVGSLDAVNQLLQAFNQTYAGKLTPHGQALVSAGLFTEAQLKQLGAVIPTIPLVPANAPNPWHNTFRGDVRVSRPIKIHERWTVRPFADIINLFNHNPAGLYGGLLGRFGSLNFDYAAAAAGQKASDLTASIHRLSSGAEGNRLVQIGVRLDF